VQPPKRKRQGGDRDPKRQRTEENLVDNEVEEEDKEEQKPTMHVFFDIKAMQLQNEPNLLIVETEEEDKPVIFAGEPCVKEFLEWLEELTEDDERNVTVIAHNFQGHDGYLVAKEYYGKNQKSICKVLWWI